MNAEKTGTNAANLSADRATRAMMEKAVDDGVTLVWERSAAQKPRCAFGARGVCCTNCNMGPCRVTPGTEERGVCGATADTMAARNFVRAIAAGAAAHADHARHIAMTLYRAVRGEAPDYAVKDEAKLAALTAELGLGAPRRDQQDMARALVDYLRHEFGTIKGSLGFTARAPGRRRAVWEAAGITPRGVDREVVEALHRTHIGVDSDYVSLVRHGLRTALSDGWGGSMIATELSDVLFGTPQPVHGRSNLGVLKADHVNIILHGHEPSLSDIMVTAALERDMLALADGVGAAGINVCGMCCTGDETLMRNGIPMAGNFLQQEAAVVTGAVEAVVVDVQCIMPSLPQVAEHYHTKIISTAGRAAFPGARHVAFDVRNALSVAKNIIRLAVENFPRRDPSLVNIPADIADYTAGFSVEAILEIMGGGAAPLTEALKSGAIRGVAVLVGCNNPHYKHDHGHLHFARRMLRENVPVLVTGCAAIACAKGGLLRPEAASEAGPGLAGVCASFGVPPVLHMGSCVDVSRVLTLMARLADSLNADICDLPAAAFAPEWMSEKAVSISAYTVASGIHTILGAAPAVRGGEKVTALLTEGLRDMVGAVFAVEADPDKAADQALAHMRAKRVNLGWAQIIPPPGRPRGF